MRNDVRRADVVNVGVLGPVVATIGDDPVELGGPRQQALLAMLTLHRGETVSTTALADAVWDGAPPDAADRTFRTYVARLRRALSHPGLEGADVILTQSGGYRLAASRTSVDSDRFDACVRTARDHLAVGEAAIACRLLVEALDLWRGNAYGPFADQSWAQPETLRLEEQRVSASELHIRALLDMDSEDAVAALDRLTAEHPFRESLVRLRVLALYRAGRHADAVGAIRGFRERLADETGLDPSPQLVELERMVLAQDPRLDRPVGGRRRRGYVIHEIVANTAIGPVHRAEQPSIGREVAVTVVPPETADDAQVVRMFEARAQQVAAIEHPHILPLYDYWREPGAAFLVTRFPSGGTLSQRLRSGLMPLDQIATVVDQVGEALLVAHGCGVVHGALGTDAVFFDAQGDAYLGAFPLVGVTSSATSDVHGLLRLVLAMSGDHAVLRSATDGQATLSVAATQLPTPVREIVRDLLDPPAEGPSTLARLLPELRAALRGDGPSTGGVADLGRAGASGPNPYRGLAAFRETDADVFFGRRELTNLLVGRLTRQPLVAVVGPSGSGKSSVVRAGLLPRLRDAGAYVTTMVPGTRPLEELAIALSRIAAVEMPDVADAVASDVDGLTRTVRQMLPDPNGEAVLVVDQFEEMFTLADVDERDALLRALEHAVASPQRRLRVVLTLRADFLGRALEHPVAGPLLRDRSIMVTPLAADDLHEAVVGPAEVAGVAVEPALATAVAADAVRAPGSLPMVQFALTEVYAAAEDGTMTLAAYRRLGGIEGVLGQRAEEVHASLDAAHRDAARVLFQRLVVPNDDGPPTRRRAARTELATVPDAAIEAFGAARLLRFDVDEETREPTVEVTHEALFRKWPRLVAWVEDGIDDLRLLGHLTASAEDWERSDRAESELYSGMRLASALMFAARHEGELTPLENAFLDAGRGREVHEQEGERLRLRRLRVLTAGLAAGLVLALVAGGFALTSQREQRRTALAAQADALAFAASKEIDEDPERAALLAAEAYAAAPDVESQGALLDVLDVDTRILSITPTPFDLCGEPTATSEVAAFAIADADGHRIEVRTIEQRVVHAIEASNAADSSCVAVDPSGRWVLEKFESRLMVRDATTGDRVAERDDVRRPGTDRSVMYHPSEPVAALVSADETIQYVDPATLEEVAVVDRATSGTPILLKYSEDGSLLAWLEDDTVHVARDSRVIASTTAPPETEIEDVVVSAGAGLFGWVASDHLAVVSLTTPSEAARRIDLSGEFFPFGMGGVIEPSGRRIAVATAEGIEVLDLATGDPDGPPIAVDASIVKLFWGSAPGMLNGAGPKGVYRLDVNRRLPVGELTAPMSLAGLFNVTPAPDGSGAIAFSADEVAHVDAATGTGTSLGPRDEQLPLAVALKDGGWLHVDAVNGFVERGTQTGPSLRVPFPAGVTRLSDTQLGAVESNGSIAVVVASGSDPLNSAVYVIDLVTATVTHSFQPPEDRSYFGAAPLGDSLLVVADDLYQWWVVDLDGGEVDGPRVLGVGRETVTGHPSRRRYATSDFNGDINVVDLDDDRTTQLVGAASVAWQVRFVGDDRLISRHQDGSTFVWDISSGSLVGRLFSTDGFTYYGIEVTETDELVQVTPDGIATIPLQPDRWLSAVCSLVARPLTQQELNAITPGRTPLNPCDVEP